MNGTTQPMMLVRLPPVNGWDVYRSQNSEFWMRDVDLGRRAGLTRPRNVRRTIIKAIGEGQLVDATRQHRSHESDVFTAGFRKVSGKSRQIKPNEHRAHVSDVHLALFYESIESVTLGNGALREVPTYFLNPRGVLRVLRRMRSNVAEDLLDELIEGALRVFEDLKTGRISIPGIGSGVSEQRVREVCREEFRDSFHNELREIREQLNTLATPPIVGNAHNQRAPVLALPIASPPSVPSPLSRAEKKERLFEVLKPGNPTLVVNRVLKALDEHLNKFSLDELIREGTILLLQSKGLQAGEVNSAKTSDEPQAIPEAKPPHQPPVSHDERPAVPTAPIDLVAKYFSAFDNVPMDATTRRLLLVLLQSVDADTGVRAIPMHELCKKMGVPRQTINEHREILIDLGYLSMREHIDCDGINPTVYRLHFPAFPRK